MGPQPGLSGILGWCQTSPGAEAAPDMAALIQNGSMFETPVLCVFLRNPLASGTCWEGGAQRQQVERCLRHRVEHMELRDRTLSRRSLILGGSRGLGWVVIQRTDRSEQIYAEFVNLERKF